MKIKKLYPGVIFKEKKSGIIKICTGERGAASITIRGAIHPDYIKDLWLVLPYQNRFGHKVLPNGTAIEKARPGEFEGRYAPWDIEDDDLEVLGRVNDFLPKKFTEIEDESETTT